MSAAWLKWIYHIMAFLKQNTHCQLTDNIFHVCRLVIWYFYWLRITKIVNCPIKFNFIIVQIDKRLSYLFTRIIHLQLIIIISLVSDFDFFSSYTVNFYQWNAMILSIQSHCNSFIESSRDWAYQWSWTIIISI
jgi:hypothetical protein